VFRGRGDDYKTNSESKYMTSFRLYVYIYIFKRDRFSSQILDDIFVFVKVFLAYAYRLQPDQKNLYEDLLF
jgi:hypothetical protein